MKEKIQNYYQVFSFHFLPTEERKKEMKGKEGFITIQTTSSVPIDKLA
jgi:hypothetical protein